MDTNHAESGLGSVESFQEARQQYGEGYQKLSQEIETLKKQIEAEEFRRDSNSSLAAFGAATYLGTDEEGNDIYAESPDTSPAFDKMEDAEKKITELKQDLTTKQSELKAYGKQARMAGVKDYNRYESPDKEKKKKVVAKKPKIKQPREDLTYNEDEEFYEGTEEPPQ